MLSRRPYNTGFALVLVSALAAACTGEPGDRPATWEYLHPAIIAPSCATSSCHTARVETAGVALDERRAAYIDLIDRRFVVPGDSASALMSLLEGDERRRMPPDAPLPAADIELIRAWIEAGAPE
ncbi:MAG TPA: c-type cytochrome domain-containing protein [Kofleriaceae bacterium]|nr:c-type cytochrome domain-containing protein [Kofleriaceae bacterium]